MSYEQLAYLHLGTILPAFVIGTWLLASRKGSPPHRALGKLYMGLMLFSAGVTLFMPAQVGPHVLGHLGFIHLFAFFTLYAVPKALLAARRHDARAHARAMIGLYVGGLLVAGSFAFMPGRLLHRWLFG